MPSLRMVLWASAGVAVMAASVAEFKNPTAFRWNCAPMYSDTGFHRTCQFEAIPRLKGLFRARERRYEEPSRPHHLTKRAVA